MRLVWIAPCWYYPRDNLCDGALNHELGLSAEMPGSHIAAALHCAYTSINVLFLQRQVKLRKDPRRTTYSRQVEQ